MVSQYEIEYKEKLHVGYRSTGYKSCRWLGMGIEIWKKKPKINVMAKLEEYCKPQKQVIYRGQRFNNRKQIFFDARYKHVTQASRLHSRQKPAVPKIANRVFIQNFLYPYPVLIVLVYVIPT